MARDNDSAIQGTREAAASLQNQAQVLGEQVARFKV